MPKSFFVYSKFAAAAVVVVYVFFDVTDAGNNQEEVLSPYCYLCRRRH